MRKLVPFLLIPLLAAVFYLRLKHSNTFYLGGIQVNEPNHQEWISTLKSTGMNTVSITVYVRQKAWNSPNLWWKKEETSVINEIISAKEAGLKVVLIPRIVLDHYFEENRFLWHGMIFPKKENVNQWFENYSRFINQWAQISEQYNVDVLAIGSEMRALSGTLPVGKIPQLPAYYLDQEKQENYLNKYLAFEDQINVNELWVRGADNYKNLRSYLQDEIKANQNWAQQVSQYHEEDPVKSINEHRSLLLENWKKLISEVRQLYSGQLTYAANFDNYQNVGFWEELDFMGINAYFQLSEWTPSGIEDKYQKLTASWENIFAEMNRFQESQNIDVPVLFTELGYINREHCSVMPWKGHGFSILEKEAIKKLVIWQEQKIDHQERTNALQALYEATRNIHKPSLQGILYWKFTTKDYHLPYEPFALHLRTQHPDPLQIALSKFNRQQQIFSPQVLPLFFSSK